MITYRLDTEQRRQGWRALAGRLPLVVLPVFALGLFHGKVLQALGSVAALAGFAAALMVTSRFSFTTLDERGIRTRTFFLPRRSVPWPQVAAIGPVRRGTSVVVLVTRADGTRFGLGAPTTGLGFPDPLFEARTDEIIRTWQSHIPDGGAPGVATGARVRWRRAGLGVAAGVLWIGIPFMLLGSFLVAHEDLAPAGQVRVRAVVVEMDSQYNPPVFGLESMAGYEFPASQVTTGGGRAYSAMMSSGTKVGDIVTIVYPRSDPTDLEDERLQPVWWHDALPPVVFAVAGGIGAVVVRHLLTRSHRLPRW